MVLWRAQLSATAHEANLEAAIPPMGWNSWDSYGLPHRVEIQTAPAPWRGAGLQLAKRMLCQFRLHAAVSSQLSVLS